MHNNKNTFGKREREQGNNSNKNVLEGPGIHGAGDDDDENNKSNGFFFSGHEQEQWLMMNVVMVALMMMVVVLRMQMVPVPMGHGFSFFLNSFSIFLLFKGEKNKRNRIICLDMTVIK
ncbi:hypothetical protein PIB30_117521 [Stylosanthes scabra]|uniref:Transmembrane protein n=1 Tax=Stylosanthes scabra TaxID=79078 RepID=A0ABU6UGP3_9FABA|nr:hypothetical protein [Stylosanthes scabra]